MYGYALGTLRTNTGDHGRCSAKTCLADNVLLSERDSAAAKIKHVNAGCECWTVEAPIDEIVTTLREGQIPVLRIGTDDGYKLSLHARQGNHDKSGGRYVAISHCWIDGLGSPTSNTIAHCQLTRIADRLGLLEASESCGELSMWIDTLCVPVDAQYRDLRAMAITKMHEIYEKAYAVMVMDEDLARLPRNPSIEELGMRLHLSVWTSRLWTYQEGALNERLLVMTRDRVLDVDECVKSALQRNTSEDRLQRDLVDKAIRDTIFGLG